MNRAFPLMLVGQIAIVLGCANVKTPSSAGAGGTAGGGQGGNGSGGFTPPPPGCTGPCTDFPAAPVIDGGAPSNSPSIFGAAGTGADGGPCLLEPAIGALFP